MSDLLSTGSIGPDTLTLTLDATRLAEALGVSSTDLAEGLNQFTADFQMRRRGAEHSVEEVGAKLRAMMPWIAESKLVDKEKN